MNRRITLGNVTNNHSGRSTLLGVGSKQSLGANSTKAALKRFSLATVPNTGASQNTSRSEIKSVDESRPPRKSSHNGGRMQDPRPIPDKKEMARSTRILVNYLTDRGYDHPISQKTLARPTARDFNNIISFLFREIDPNWQPTEGGKFEDDITAMLKYIRYPVAISKTALSAVGSPHTWPTLLACLTWIIELLNYDQEVEQAEAERGCRGFDGDPASDEKAFYDYLGRAYASFLMGDDDLYTALEQELVSGFDKGQDSISAEVASLQLKNEMLRRQMEGLKARRDNLPVQERRRDALALDREQLLVLIGQLKSHKASLSEKNAKRTEEVAEKQQQLKLVKSEVEELKAAVAGQELSAEDVARIGRERKRLEEGLASASEFRQKQLKNLWEAEMSLSRKMESLEGKVREYNTKATQLLLIPPTAKNAQNQNFELRFNKQALEQPSGLDLVYGKEKAATNLSNLKDAIKKSEQKSKQQLLDFLDQEQASEDSLAEAMEALTAEQQRRHKLEETLRREKETLLLSMKENATEIEALEQNIIVLRNQAEAERKCARNQTKQAKLLAEIEATSEEQEVKKNALHNAIIDMLNLCTENKENLQKQLAELKEFCIEKLSHLKATS